MDLEISHILQMFLAALGSSPSTVGILIVDAFLSATKLSCTCSSKLRDLELPKEHQFCSGFDAMSKDLVAFKRLDY